MLEVLKLRDKLVQKATLDDNDIWIKLTEPTEEEINEVHNKFGIDIDFLKAPLDLEEVSRLEMEEDEVLILVNASQEIETETQGISYITVPVGIIVRDDIIITVTLKKLDVLEKMTKFKGLNASINKRTKFVMQIIYNITIEYLVTLRRISRTTDEIEKTLYKNRQNEYLLQLLTLEKNLVYFLTALKSNEQVINRVFRFKAMPFYEEDEDFFEDLIIELKQAQEMANITTKIIVSIRDAFSSLMSNTLNNTMKILASFTIILTIPTMIFSFFGMNTYMGSNTHSIYMTLTILIASVLVSVILFKIMKDKNMF